MLHEAIRRGCEIYHKTGAAYDEAYQDYLHDKNSRKWSNPEMLDFQEAKRLIDFANRWKSRMPSDSTNVQQILEGLKIEVPKLSLLMGNNLLNVKFEEVTSDELSVSQLIAEVFNGIATSGRRYESVATSKMLNAAVNPDLFVMWDGAIQSGYGLSGTGYEYGHVFLPRMQKLIDRATRQVMRKKRLPQDEAINSFTDGCKNKNSLAKILDEYNYVKFTLRDSRLRYLD